MPDATPSPTATPPPPLSISEIADRIRAERGECTYMTVWRVIRRLKLPPYAQSGAIRFYTPDQAALIAAKVRAPNKKKAPSPADA